MILNLFFILCTVTFYTSKYSAYVSSNFSIFSSHHFHIFPAGNDRPMAPVASYLCLFLTVSALQLVFESLLGKVVLPDTGLGDGTL